MGLPSRRAPTASTPRSYAACAGTIGARARARVRVRVRVRVRARVRVRVRVRVTRLSKSSCSRHALQAELGEWYQLLAVLDAQRQSELSLVQVRVSSP